MRLLAVAAAALLLAGCSTSSTVTGSPAALLGVTPAQARTAVIRFGTPVDRDLAVIRRMDDAGDANLDDWSAPCASLASAAATSASEFRTYPWPNRAAQADAAALAGLLDTTATAMQQCTGATNVYALAADLRAVPNLTGLGAALRAALR